MKDLVIMCDDIICMKEVFELGDVGDFILCDYQEVECKVVVKFDFYIILVLFIVYLLCFIDRVNIGMKVFYFFFYSRFIGDFVVFDILIFW